MSVWYTGSASCKETRTRRARSGVFTGIPACRIRRLPGVFQEALLPTASVPGVTKYSVTRSDFLVMFGYNAASLKNAQADSLA
jgi:hypothetical protein